MIPTRYISAGPMQAQADPNAAMAAGEAMQQVGNAISEVGQMGTEMYGKYRKIKEGGAINAFMADADRQAGEFAIGLARRSDTDAWPADWQSKTEEMRTKAKALGLSNEGMASLDDDFTKWSSNRSTNFATQAATKGLAIAKAQTQQSLEYHASRFDIEAYNRTKNIGLETGQLNPAEGQQADLYIGELIAKNDVQKMVEGNPEEFLTFDKEAMIRNAPGITTEMIDRGMVEAKALIRNRTMAATDSGFDDIYSDKITTPEQIDLDPRFAKFSPTIKKEMKDGLRNYQHQKATGVLNSPESQALAFGKASSLLLDYVPQEEGYDKKYVEISQALRQMPEGSPERKELQRQVDNIRNPEKRAGAKTHFEAGLKSLDEAYTNGAFGKPTETAKMPTQRAINEGFLKDPAKLTNLGFSTEQIAEINAKIGVDGKDDPTNKSRSDAFKRLWISRKGKESADPYVKSTAEAIVNGDTDIPYVSPESNRRTAEEAVAIKTRFGKAKIELLEWRKINPQASNEEINDKIFKLAGAEARKKLSANIYQERPTRTTPGARITSYGYASDETPDSNSAVGIGAWVGDDEARSIKAGKDTPNKLKPGDFAVSPDEEANLKQAGIRPGDTVNLKISDGSTITGRWMDRTAPSYNGKKLTGRYDIYSPKGVHPLDGKAVIGWVAGLEGEKATPVSSTGNVKTANGNTYTEDDLNNADKPMALPDASEASNNDY